MVIGNRLCFTSANYADLLQCSANTERACWLPTKTVCKSCVPWYSSVRCSRCRNPAGVRKSCIILVVLSAFSATIMYPQCPETKESHFYLRQRGYLFIYLFIYLYKIAREVQKKRKRYIQYSIDVATAEMTSAVVKVMGVRGLSPLLRFEPPAIVWAPWLNL